MAGQTVGQCAFCDTPLGTSIAGGRGTRLPDYCRACGDKYTKELGEGWDREQWAVEYFQSHRRLQYVERVEGSWERLDRDTGSPKDPHRERMGATLSADAVDQAPGQPGTGQDPVLDKLIADYVVQGWGGNRVHRELKSMGWNISQRTVYYRIAQAKKASHRTAEGQVVEELLDPRTGEPLVVTDQAQVYVQKVC